MHSCLLIRPPHDIGESHEEVYQHAHLSVPKGILKETGNVKSSDAGQAAHDQCRGPAVVRSQPTENFPGLTIERDPNAEPAEQSDDPPFDDHLHGVAMQMRLSVPKRVRMLVRRVDALHSFHPDAGPGML